jgi:NTE family protein
MDRRERPPEGAIGKAIDVFRVKQYFDAISTSRELAAGFAADAQLLRGLAAGLLPFARRRREPVRDPFGGARAARLHLPWNRLSVVATGGSGAMAALVGVLRACEEVEVRPASISLASGAALFGFPIAAGHSAAEVAEFALSLEPRDYVDVDWAGLVTLAPRRGRGFAGIVKGDRLQAKYRELLGDMRLGDLDVPTYAPLWNIDDNRVDYIGPRTHPELPVATAVRLAVSLPLFLDPQPLHGAYWGDGGVVDILPVHPVLDIEEPPQAALVLNCFYPPGFEGELIPGWREQTFSIFRAASQVRTAQQAQLARENLARLRREVPDVMLLEPVPYAAVRGGRFYLQFLDSSMWPDFMRAGRRAALRALKAAARRHPQAA